MNFRAFSFVVVGFLFIFFQTGLFSEDTVLLLLISFLFGFFYFIVFLISIGIDLYRLATSQITFPFKSTLVGLVMIVVNIGFGQYLNAPYSDDLLVKEYYLNEDSSLRLYEKGNLTYSKNDFFGSSTRYGHYAKKGNLIYFDILIHDGETKSHIARISKSNELILEKE